MTHVVLSATITESSLRQQSHPSMTWMGKRRIALIQNLNNEDRYLFIVPQGVWQLIVVIAHSLWACLWLKHCSVEWFNPCGIMTTFSVDNFCLNFSALQTGNYSADRSLNWFAVILVLHAVNHRVRLVNCPIAVSAAIAWDCGVPKINLLFFVFIRKRASIPENERRKWFVCTWGFKQYLLKTLTTGS